MQQQTGHCLVISYRVVWSELHTQGEFAAAWQRATRLINTEHTMAASVHIKLVMSQYCRGVDDLYIVCDLCALLNTAQVQYRGTKRHYWTYR